MWHASNTERTMDMDSANVTDTKRTMDVDSANVTNTDVGKRRTKKVQLITQDN